MIVVLFGGGLAGADQRRLAIGLRDHLVGHRVVALSLVLLMRHGRPDLVGAGGVAGVAGLFLSKLGTWCRSRSRSSSPVGGHVRRRDRRTPGTADRGSPAGGGHARCRADVERSSCSPTRRSRRRPPTSSPSQSSSASNWRCVRGRRIFARIELGSWFSSSSPSRSCSCATWMRRLVGARC